MSNRTQPLRAEHTGLGPAMFFISALSATAGVMAILLWQGNAKYVGGLPVPPSGGVAFALNFHPLVLGLIALLLGVVGFGLWATSIGLGLAGKPHAGLIWNLLTAAALAPAGFIAVKWLGWA